jgi:serine phosphatase RsbU (regulator of sigma subunit)/biotin operon repressor
LWCSNIWMMTRRLPPSADRLLSALLMLEAHGRLTGRELADRLGVSERTVRRDMAALNAAGVPVFAPGGGNAAWQLDENWRAQAAELDEVELGAVLMAHTRVIGDGHLADAAERGLDKLMSSLSPALRERADSIRQRVYVDPTGWRGTKENLSMLPVVQDALSLDRKLAIAYWKAGRERVERRINPLGLVAKGSTWYLVAHTPDGFRTYRVSRIEEAKVLDESCERPPDFDLITYWRTSTEQFQDEVSRALEAERRAKAEREEAERRAAQELQIAKQVQGRLFPQRLPPLHTLEYAGICVQARQVGGDYYDFLDLGDGRLGIVIGDIAGKGIAAALLMANLQANLRSQCAIAWDQPERFLRCVNQLFYESTVDSAYATLLYAEYDDATRRMRYANCGHLPALLLHTDGSLERLNSTTTVLGLFEEWECSTGECRLQPGDVLALYTDGVTESFNGSGEEFGERRLIEVLRRDRELPPTAMLASLTNEVQRFSPGEQHDDITLLVARSTE